MLTDGRFVTIPIPSEYASRLPLHEIRNQLERIHPHLCVHSLLLLALRAWIWPCFSLLHSPFSPNLTHPCDNSPLNNQYSSINNKCPAIVALGRITTESAQYGQKKRKKYCTQPFRTLLYLPKKPNEAQRPLIAAKNRRSLCTDG